MKKASELKVGDNLSGGYTVTSVSKDSKYMMRVVCGNRIFLWAARKEVTVL
jgi:hypothetical protein